MFNRYLQKCLNALLVVTLHCSSCLLGTLGCSRTPDDHEAALKLHLTPEAVASFRKVSGISDRELLRKDAERLRDLLLEKKYTDLPLARNHFLFLQQRSENNRIPPGAKLLAVSDLHRLQARICQQHRAFAAFLPLECAERPFKAGLGTSSAKWDPLGPSQVGGRTRAIVVNPSNENELWLASIAGGVWHSINGGASFKPTNDFMPNMVVSTLVLDPTNNRVLFAGTGEGFGNSDALRGAGIYKTSDGITWTPISATVPRATDNEPPFRFVNRLAFSSDGKTLLAATWKGIYQSTDASHDDWTLRIRGNFGDVKFHPSDPRIAVAGGLDTGQAYFSEDGGSTWHTAKHDDSWEHVWGPNNVSPGRVELAFAAADAGGEHHVVYASVDNLSGQIWRSQDDGQNYALMKSNTSDNFLAYYLGDQGWYSNAIWAGDPTNADLVVVGGINLWKSMDGGGTLTEITDWQNSASVHADHHIILSSPHFDGKRNKTVYFGNDGGVYKTLDISLSGTDELKTKGYENLNHDYAVTQFYGIVSNPVSGTLLGGAQDNGTLELTKGAQPSQWTEEFGGDGGFCSTDQHNGSVLFGEYVYLDLHRTLDDGKTSEEITGQYYDDKDNQFHWRAGNHTIPDAESQSANFIAPFAVDSEDGNRLFAGGASLWRTTNAKAAYDIQNRSSGPSWSQIKTPLPGWNQGSDVPNFISTLTLDQRNPGTLWLGYDRGDLYLSRNAYSATPSWQQILNVGSEKRPGRLVTRIMVDPLNSNIIYVAYGGYSESHTPDNIWKSTDGGATWKNISTNLPAAPIYALTSYPGKSHYIYAGTEMGIFASEDGGIHWSASNEGPTNTAVEDFTWIGESLVAATHGRGVWRIDLSSADLHTHKGPLAKAQSRKPRSTS